MSVTPTTITDISGYTGYSTGDLTYYNSDSDYHYYAPSWNADGSYGLRVKFTAGTGYNVWDDGGGSDPTSVDDNADGYVYGYNSSGTLVIKFLKPTSASWISSGGGTSTEGVSVPNGSITRDSFGALYFTVDKSSPLTVGTHDYGFYLDGYLQGTINHSSNTVDAVGYQNNPSDGLWQLSYQGGSSLQLLASYTVGSKKVFCNFW